MNRIFPRLYAHLVAVVAILCATGLTLSCSEQLFPTAGQSRLPEAIFTVQGEAKQVVVRAVTRDITCPSIQFDNRAKQAMSVRAEPATEANRNDNGQLQTKAAVFDVITCEAQWQLGAQRARVAGQLVPAPHQQINRILLVSDTGCRMKASDNGFQDCQQQWPFAQAAQSAAALKPDLVIHLGDINYRESPCPEANTGCANSPWGYGFDTWEADLFAPAKPLLAAAPWIFVRGNHESCIRAGQGWFRFLDAQPWSELRSCNLASNDLAADYSEPYAVSITSKLNFIVFDSSKSPAKALTPKDVAYEKYTAEVAQVKKLSQRVPTNFFLSHHPVLGFGLPEKGDPTHTIKLGSLSLQSVMKNIEPQRLLPSSVEVAISGHVHLFEAIGFSTPHPVTLVMGNSGSLNEGKLPEVIPAGVEPYPGAVVNDFVTMADYGFASLDRVESADDNHWLLTEYKADGTPVYRCDINNGKSHCSRL